MTNPTQSKTVFRWQFNGKILGFVVLFLPLTIWLGFWQLSRGDEKQAMLDEQMARETASPVALATLDLNQDQQYRRVVTEGQFQNAFTVLLENRIRDGRPGFEVVTLFKLEDNADPFWVNRGWIAGYLDRDRLPNITDIEGDVTLTGYLYRPAKEPFTVGEESWRQRWPQVLQNLDVALLSEKMRVDTAAYRLRLDQSSRGALRTGWPVVNVMPEKHRGYAVQWFAMAAALLVLAIFANSNLSAVLFSRKR